MLSSSISLCACFSLSRARFLLIVFDFSVFPSPVAVGLVVLWCAFFFLVFTCVWGLVVGLWCGATVLRWFAECWLLRRFWYFPDWGCDLAATICCFPGLSAKLHDFGIGAYGGVVAHSSPSELRSHQMAHGGVRSALEPIRAELTSNGS